MKTITNIAFALLIASSVFSGIQAGAQTTNDKTVQKALHTIESNSKMVEEYAHIYEWDNVDNEVDRIVAAEKKVYKMSTKQAQRDALSAAVKELRAARFQRNSERAVKAAAQVKTVADELLK